MTLPRDIVVEALHEDIVDRVFFLQTIRESQPDVDSSSNLESEVLRELLQSGEVDVGYAEWQVNEKYEFIAWNGTVDERIVRAIEVSANAEDGDKRFAYWLCLRRYVDRFEGG